MPFLQYVKSLFHGLAPSHERELLVYFEGLYEHLHPSVVLFIFIFIPQLHLPVIESIIEFGGPVLTHLLLPSPNIP